MIEGYFKQLLDSGAYLSIETDQNDLNWIFNGPELDEIIPFEGNCREVFPDRKWEDMKAERKTFEKISSAAECYGKWEPENKRYAIGWHSVRDEFEEIIKNPVVTFEKLTKT